MMNHIASENVMRQPVSEVINVNPIHFVNFLGIRANSHDEVNRITFLLILHPPGLEGQLFYLTRNIKNLLSLLHDRLSVAIVNEKGEKKKKTEEKVLEKKKKYSYTQLILMAFASSPGNCLTLEELQRKTNIDKNTLLVYLHRMHEKGFISRHWRHYSDKKARLYCLKYKDELLR